MVQSLITIGGICLTNSDNASSPSLAATTSWPKRVNVALSHLHETGSSSAIRIFTGPLDSLIWTESLQTQEALDRHRTSQADNRAESKMKRCFRTRSVSLCSGASLASGPLESPAPGRRGWLAKF